MRWLEDFIGAVAVVLFGLLSLWFAWSLEPLERRLCALKTSSLEQALDQPPEAPIDPPASVEPPQGALPAPALTRRPPQPAIPHPGGEK
jgi:hypothetical protein